jgi:hypothetical protein
MVVAVVEILAVHNLAHQVVEDLEMDLLDLQVLQQ